MAMKKDQFKKIKLSKNCSLLFGSNSKGDPVVVIETFEEDSVVLSKDTFEKLKKAKFLS